ncbi:MarR family transcriptional regulator [Georgenia yuyongxinii]|uniref:MarR family transcriptional regulator n=1 Tax=Georgenia yuyongxinii TaxID=2589797 RepID=A0A5B8C384_9MICO|nr:MarR family transcriptional regulator [Georgenia yuyongxinii]QDC24510.1 MarR family transcriptional regulator [Georgenia yuyongxinii]
MAANQARDGVLQRHGVVERDAALEREVADDIHAAFVSVLRWASRSAVRGRLWADGGVELTPTDAWLLEALATHSPMRVTMLATWQGVDKSTVTPQVRRLEQAGLVDRHRDPVDGRASLLTLSAAGREVRERVRAVGGDVLSEGMADWTESDRRTFARLLGRFAQTLDGGPRREAAAAGPATGAHAD